MRALIIANGEPPSHGLVARLLPGVDLVVAADGGADIALRMGLYVHAIVGDLDSVSREARKAIPEARFHHVPRLDRTDLEKAAEFAVEAGCGELDIVGATAGRADHALANLSILPLFRGRAAVRLHDELFETSLVDGATVIEGEPGTLVSLVAIGQCEGVTTRGLRWDLAGATLRFSPLGIHNEIEKSPALVVCERGDLLLFKGRFVEKHR
jgi:thiamine pyrophosphokinase